MFDLASLRQRCAEGEQFRFLFFWGHQPSKDGRITASCLSQWYEASFEVAGVTYPTAEHWMMASKARLFADDDSLHQILQTADPRTAKALGRGVHNFDEGVWKSHCRQLVTDGNAAKFGQNKALGEFLLATENQVLVEASPYDRIWGIGLKADDPRAKHPATWQGENLLGFSLMDVRDALRQ